jgi:hypothetical protein
LVALAAGVAAVDGATAGTAAAVAVVAVVVGLALAVAAFFVDAFLAGEAERFRLVAPPAALGLLADDAFFVLVPPDFLLPVADFDGLADFFAVAFFEVVFLTVFFF